MVSSAMAEIMNKKTGAKISVDISATRLSSGDPVGFPPHLHRWLSIIVYRKKCCVMFKR